MAAINKSPIMCEPAILGGTTNMPNLEAVELLSARDGRLLGEAWELEKWGV